ncbi:MAG: hypothetical protein KJ626_00580 [Verrucomicrobia bacterium]|nr:hypothetical protein [Verrucomicrobiota bacterium]
MKTTHQHKNQGREGAILGVVLIVLVIIAFLGAGLMSLTSADAFETGRAIAGAQAFWTAEAGLELVKARGGKVKEPYPDIYGATPIILSGTTSKGSYQVTINDKPGYSNAGAIKRYTIVSQGTAANGIVKNVAIEAEIESFATYMHATHSEETSGGDNIYFGPGDILDGQVYVNDQLNIYGGGPTRPRITELTRSAASSVNYQAGASPLTFQGGLQLNATPLPFFNDPEFDPIADVEQQALSGGLALNGNYRFEFSDDGSFTYEKRVGGSWQAPSTGTLSSINGAIYVDGNVVLKKSKVNGEMTLASEGSIRLTDDITYESADGYNLHSSSFDPSVLDDYVGLVARTEVEIRRSDSLRFDDIAVHAAILVTDDGDGFNTYRKYENIGTPYIWLYGSLGQYRRGVVGRSDGKGFVKGYKYDTRLLGHPPPFYPYSAYDYSGWRTWSG